MNVDLADNLGEIAERLVSDRDAGRLIEVQHLARYLWAAGAASGRRVLDAGCGAGDGCVVLAAGDAAQVTGVDITESVLQSSAATMPDTVTLIPGDLESLELPDDSFDLVVCFEVLEHVDEPLAVLDELTRVLAPGGVLLVSSAVTQGAAQPGQRPTAADALRESLATRLAHVALARQGDYIASALLADDQFTAGGGERLEAVTVRKLVTAVPGQETRTIALASDAPLPALDPMLLMSGTLELREWLAESESQAREVSDRDARIADLDERLIESRRMSGLLIDAEQRLARIPDLEQRIEDLEHALTAAHDAADHARRQFGEVDARLMDSERVMVDVLGSPSWQITKPLRAAKKLLGR